MSPTNAAITFARTRSLELAALFSLVVSLLTSVILARTVGPAGRGEVVVIATWAQLMGWAGALSIDKALMARRSDGHRQIGVPTAEGLSTLLSAGFLAAVLSLFISGLLLSSPLLRAAMFVAVLGTVAVEARAAALLVHERWRAYAALRFAQPLGYLLGCSLAAGLATISPAIGVGAFVVALCVSLWLPALFIGGLPQPNFRWPDAVQLRALFAFAGTYHVGTVLYVASTRIDVMTMPMRFTSAEVGVYAVATSAGQLVALLGSSNLIRGLTGQVSFAQRIDRAGFAIAAVLAASTAAIVGWLVPFVYGAAFAGATLPARLLCLSGLLLYVTQGINGQLAGRGRPWATALVNGAGVLSFMAMFSLSDTLAEVAAANIVSAAMSLLLAWWLSGRGQTATREVEQCASESMLPRSCQDVQLASKPSLTVFSANSPQTPIMKSKQ